jgi:hypothetical protein
VESAKLVSMSLWQNRERGGNVLDALQLGEGSNLFSWILDKVLLSKLGLVGVFDFEIHRMALWRGMVSAFVASWYRAHDYVHGF